VLVTFFIERLQTSYSCHGFYVFNVFKILFLNSFISML